MPSLSERLGANITTVHPNSRVAAALARSGVPKTPEILRIINLPRRDFDPSAYPDASVLYSLGRCTRKTCQYCLQGPPALRPIQNAIIVEAAQNAGAFIAAGVGTGKTIPSFLLHDALGASQTVLMVPANLREKTFSDLPEIQKHFKIPQVYRDEDWEAGKLGVYVIGYSEVSQTDASDLLDKIQPDLVVADEVQYLRNPKAARTRRFLRYMRKAPCKFVAMTGSPVSRSILDFAHLIERCLGKNSPVPHDYPTLSAMADAIDNEGKEGATGVGALALMLEDGESARDGFCKRFIQSPGVIVTHDISCDVPIEIREFIVKPPQVITDALNKLEKEWSWDGEDFEGALDLARYQRQIVQGFYYKPVWPGGVPDLEWLAKSNAWKRAIRARLAHQNRQGQDSPALLEALAESGQWTPPEWIDWLTVRDRPEPERVPVELSRWLIDLALNWATTNTGIIWVNSPVLGHWLAERGIPYFGEGDDKELNAYAKDALELRVKPQTIACSVQAHGTGKNLQAWSSNLVLYPMSLGAMWEQVIGRTHRPGQLAEVVTFDVILGSIGAIGAMSKAYDDSLFQQQLTGQPHRLQLAIKVDCSQDTRLDTPILDDRFWSLP